MARFLWICLGGAVGTGARYLASTAALRWLGAGFAYGTLFVNVVGSFIIGLILAAGVRSDTVRLALTTGIMGGFTTYSTFSWETVQYIQRGAWALAALNITATLVGCLVACFLGAMLVRAL
jgi:fluoride exporter